MEILVGKLRVIEFLHNVTMDQGHLVVVDNMDHDFYPTLCNGVHHNTSDGYVALVHSNSDAYVALAHNTSDVYVALALCDCVDDSNWVSPLDIQTWVYCMTGHMC